MSVDSCLPAIALAQARQAGQLSVVRNEKYQGGPYPN